MHQHLRVFIEPVLPVSVIDPHRLFTHLDLVGVSWSRIVIDEGNCGTHKAKEYLGIKLAVGVRGSAWGHGISKGTINLLSLQFLAV